MRPGPPDSRKSIDCLTGFGLTNKERTIMIRLIVRFNGSVVRELETDQQEITIGRNGDNELQIDNIAVSGNHAVIRKEKNHYVIEDLESTNGTFVNQTCVNRRVLRERDLITIGKHSLAVAFTKFGVHGRGENISDLEKTYQLESDQQREIFKRQV
jgi:pSer/pThr/pTyr-binding forkhead associated (FHA) protein